VVVNKTAGEAVEGAGKGMIDLPRLLADRLLADRLLADKLLAEQMPGFNVPPALPEGDVLALPTAVHRLDVPVSGCVAFDRTGTALRFLNNAFSGNMVEKRYWAIIEQPKDSSVCQWIEGLSSEFAEIIHWIQFDPRKNKSIAHNEQSRGRKKAVLRCRLAGKGRDYLFLEIDLVTGRHHQIRAQLEKLGLHIKGDLKYGARRSERDGGIRLHARLLSFPRVGESCPGIPRITARAEPLIMDNLWRAFPDNSGLLTKIPQGDYNGS
jgi:23S rRNA pseudouridine1911/1915/1917 synthase